MDEKLKREIIFFFGVFTGMSLSALVALAFGL